MKKINIKGMEISIANQRGEDYISLTDIIKGEKDDQLIKKWLSAKNTIEYLGVWEKLKNMDFNPDEFEQIKNESGSNRFTMSVKQWQERTNGIGLKARSGRYGSGTYAHKDIALKFAAWISPELELLINMEFQKLKKEKAKEMDASWDIRRFLSKANYRIQTDAIHEILIPLSSLSKDKEGIIYAEEAELLNKVVFNLTAKEWRANNKDLVKKGHNIRDYGNTYQLIVISNLEPLNAELIRNNIPQDRRLTILRESAIQQLKSLSKNSKIHNTCIDSPHQSENTLEATNDLD